MPENQNRRPRWADEDWVLDVPDPEKIECRDCTWRARDRRFPSGTVQPGSTLGVCQLLSVKPHRVLYGLEKCPYYLKEKNTKERER